MAIELTTLGVEIDPSGAVQGAKVATSAADKMAREIVDALERVERESKEAGDDFTKSGKKIDTAAKKASKSVDKLGTSQKRAGKSAKQTAAGMKGMIAPLLQILQPLGLLNSGFGQLIMNGSEVVSGLGQMKGQMGGTGDAAARASQGVERMGTGMGSARAKATQFLGALKTMLPILIAAGVAIVALTAATIAFKFIKGAVKAAAEMDQYHTRLLVLTGSADQAAVALRRMNAFADETPFTDSEVFDAGVKLEGMTAGALSTTDALKSIGGAAFVAGKSFNEIADLAGRAFNAVQLGMDFIEPLKTMNSYGLVTGATTMKVIALGEAARDSGDKAANNAAMWSLIYGDLREKQEALELASKSWGGQMSTLEGKWDALLVAFGEPVKTQLLPVLVKIVDKVKESIPLFQTAGEIFGTFLSSVLGAKDAPPLHEVIFAGFDSRVRAVSQYFGNSFLSLALTIQTDLENTALAWGNGLIEATERFLNFTRQTFNDILSILDDWNPFKSATQGLADFATKAGVFGPEATPDSVTFSGSHSGGKKPISLGRIEERDVRNGALGQFAEDFANVDVNEYLKKLSGVKTAEERIASQALQEARADKEIAAKKLELAEQRQADAMATKVAAANKEADAVRETVLERLTQVKLEEDIREAQASGNDKLVQQLRDQDVIRQSISKEVRENSPALAAQLEKELQITIEAERLTENYKKQAAAAGQVGHELEKQLSYQEKLAAITQSGGGSFTRSAASFDNVTELNAYQRENLGPAASSIGGVSVDSSAFDAQRKETLKEFSQRRQELLWEAHGQQVDASRIASQERKMQLEQEHGLAMDSISRQDDRWRGLQENVFASAEGSVLQAGGRPSAGTIAEGLHQPIGGTMLEGLLGAPQPIAANSGNETIRRYHSGGVASSERTATLEDGETVLTQEAANDIRRRLRGDQASGQTGGVQVTIVNVTDPQEAAEALAANPDAILNLLGDHANELKALIS